MAINKLKLVNWRNYDEASFVFSPGTNLIVGENAIGKTNILEAIVMLAITKSFRTRKDRSLVKKGVEFAKVSGWFDDDGGVEREEELRIILVDEWRSKKELRMEGLNRKVLEVIGNLRVVYFSPEEIERFFSSPTMRRRWMDVALSLVDSRYVYLISVYRKVIQNRNKVLKRIGENRGENEELVVWDEKLIEYASQIIRWRRHLLESCQGRVKDYFKQLFGQNLDLELKYEQTTTQIDVAAGLREELEKYYSKEVRYGSSVVGSHREDIIMKLNGIDIGEWGSRAQMRLALLSLKLAELDFIRESRGEVVLLLDDIFSELDGENKNRVFDFIGRQQTIITATDINGVDIKDGNIINIE